MTKIIAITGGIGSGKSTLLKHLKKNKYKTHDSDSVVSDIYKKPNTAFINFLKKNGFNDAVKNNKVTKSIITQKIFDNSFLKKKIEINIHNVVQKNRQMFIKKNINKKNKAIFCDIPLLFENNLEKSFDFVVCIISKKITRKQRVLDKKKFSNKIFNQIIKNQTTDLDRIKRSDLIIYNNKTKKDFIMKAKNFLMDYLK